jgi:hypothetical protein
MAGKKRKAEAARLEETDRALYGAFRGAANSLSQVYTLAMGAQKASFQAGERHAMVRTPIRPWLAANVQARNSNSVGFLGVFFMSIGGEFLCPSEEAFGRRLGYPGWIFVSDSHRSSVEEIGGGSFSQPGNGIRILTEFLDRAVHNFDAYLGSANISLLVTRVGTCYFVQSG